jgi:putative membrane protein
MKNIKRILLQVALVTSIFAISSFNFVEYSVKDQQFVDKAARISLEEIKLGELAQQKSAVSEVKELGKMMEEGHRQSLDGLKALAERKSIILPSTPPQSAYEAYKNLKGKLEADFDKAYCEMMVSGHKGAIELFEKASRDSNDIQIREWAAATLPVLRVHLDHAVTCQMKCEKM